MNPALLFLILVALMTALVLWIVLRPLWAKRTNHISTANAAHSATANSNGQANVDALRIELTEARRDQKLGLLSEASLAEAERELETRVLTESQTPPNPAAPRYKGTAMALGVLLPVLAVGGYAAVGSPAAVVPDIVRPAATAQPANASQADAQMDELFKLAEERLNKEPADVKGWLLLARAKASVGLFDGAIKAYEKAAALDPKDSELWSDYADATAGLSQGQMDGKPIELINKALALDGKNIKALLLRGTWEIQKNDLPAAEKSFVLAKSFTEPNSGFAQIADNALAEIKSRQSGATTNVADKSGATPASNATAEPVSASGASGAAGVALASVTLKLSTEARTAASAASATSAMFLIVRAAGAERGPPLAAKKLALADIEKPILLAAADAMIGGAGLKPGADVVLQARLSLTGQPMVQAGDWQSEKTNATLPSTALILAIDALVKN
jgi:cytochrome c-type biogenesis protein CcmH